ncbi:AMP-binding protein [Salinispirillum sp. LH 10-3-1]|uniref:Long-chain-fatty-acid--CoA ligase n=1 Tax=Salinispirillum sp. LH 10-3-1 TaxID=2952525 RepID=A0AB38YJC6_9GAMM
MNQANDLAHYLAEHRPLDAYVSLNALLEHASRHYTDRPAFSNEGVTLTFSELDALSAELAAYWQKHTNLVPGDRVAMMLPNILHFPIVAYSLLRSGLVLVNISPLLEKAELLHQLKDSGARGLVFLEVFGDVVESIMAETDIDHVMVARLGDLHTTRRRFLINTVARYVHKRIPEFDLPQAVEFMAALELGHEHAFVPPDTQSEDVAMIQYTMGTTGLARGVLLSQRNLLANVAQIQFHLEKSSAQPSGLVAGREVILAPLPLYHVYAFTAHCLCLVAMGCHSVLVTNTRDIASIVRTMRQWDVTAMTGLNTLFAHLLTHKEFRKLDFQNYHMTLSGGMPVVPSVARAWQQATGAPLLDAYGLTEASPAVSISKAGEDYAGHCGKPLSNTEVRICDDAGTTLVQNAVGEIWVRGPQVFASYWNAPETTRQALTEDGWLRTGDLGAMNPNGEISVVDRKKDLIVVSGFQVYPSEIETVVHRHPKVASCAAIGETDAHGQQRIHLFVVPRDAEESAGEIALSDKEILHHCRAHLDGYKVPKLVTVCEDLPVSAVGKVLRRKLRGTNTRLD